jgi:hypothetical protein
MFKSLKSLFRKKDKIEATIPKYNFAQIYEDLFQTANEVFENPKSEVASEPSQLSKPKPFIDGDVLNDMRTEIINRIDHLQTNKELYINADFHIHVYSELLCAIYTAIKDSGMIHVGIYKINHMVSQSVDNGSKVIVENNDESNGKTTNPPLSIPQPPPQPLVEKQQELVNVLAKKVEESEHNSSCLCRIIGGPASVFPIDDPDGSKVRRELETSDILNSTSSIPEPSCIIDAVGHYSERELSTDNIVPLTPIPSVITLPTPVPKHNIEKCFVMKNGVLCQEENSDEEIVVDTEDDNYVSAGVKILKNTTTAEEDEVVVS